MTQLMLIPHINDGVCDCLFCRRAQRIACIDVELSETPRDDVETIEALLEEQAELIELVDEEGGV